jgi:hypothetical protein
MQDKYNSKTWIAKFKKDERFGHLRFKKLEKGYPLFDIDEDLIDVVDPDVFNQIEKNRLPFVVGSQFGLNPRIHDLEGFFNGDKYIAVLAKSLLSGTVNGLHIYHIKEGETHINFNAIAVFR